MPRVVLTTNDSLHGRCVLQAIWRRGIRLDAVLYITGDLGLPPAVRGAGMARRFLRWPRRFSRTAGRIVRFHTERRAKSAERCARVVATGAMNSRRLLRDLRALAPDWIVLGGGGILAPEVIAAANFGVLNVHPALLPYIRGCGVVGGSLEHGVALGATLHRVDPGIDTGAVVQRRLLHVGAEDNDLGALERRCGDLGAEMMADAVEAILRGDAPAAVAQTVRYPLFRWPDAEGVRRQRALAADGRALELYEAWRPLCADGARGVLPADVEPPPVFTLSPAAPQNAPAPRV